MASTGLEVYNSDGSIALGLTTRTSRVLGLIENVGGGSGVNGGISDVRFSTGTPFFIVSPINTGSIPILLDVDITGNNLTYRYKSAMGAYPPGANFLMCNILYGVT